MLVGTYVGFATVGAFASWYMYTSFLGIDLSQDGHSTVTWNQLTHWNQCEDWAGFQVKSSPPFPQHTQMPAYKLALYTPSSDVLESRSRFVEHLYLDLCRSMAEFIHGVQPSANACAYQTASC